MWQPCQLQRTRWGGSGGGALAVVACSTGSGAVRLPRRRRSSSWRGKKKLLRAVLSSAAATEADKREQSVGVVGDVAVLINGATGKMGQATAQAAAEAGVKVAPFGLAGIGIQQHEALLGGSCATICSSDQRDEVLDKALEKFPNLVVVDYTLPGAVNDNADWYCRRGVPFVMGTTGGDRAALIRTVENSGTYAVVAPQMGKQVVAFIAAMEALGEQCPGAFTGYSLQVTESHQSSKVDTSGTAKEVVKAFQRLGLRLAEDQIEKVRDPAEQIRRMKVPEEHLGGHAFHTYRLTSADGNVAFEFQHNVCGRSIYAQGTVDAVLFLAKKVKEGSSKKLFSMIDVLRGGAMR